MNYKFIFVCAVIFVEAKTECSDYLTCLSELIHGFFGTKPGNSTVNDNFNRTNETDLYEIKDFSDKHLNNILTKVSNIVNDNVTGDIVESRSKTVEFMNDDTKVLVKVFDFDQPKAIESEETFENKEEPLIFVTLPSITKIRRIATSTENPINVTSSTEEPTNVIIASENPINIITSFETPTNIIINSEKPTNIYTSSVKETNIVTNSQKPINIIVNSEKQTNNNTRSKKLANNNTSYENETNILIDADEKPSNIIVTSEKQTNINTSSEKFTNIITSSVNGKNILSNDDENPSNIVLSSEKPTNIPLPTTDLIYQVNNMAVPYANFEDNLILPDIYIDFEDNNNTDYPNIDYIEIYKDATVENVVFIPTQLPLIIDDDQIVKEVDNLIESSPTGDKISSPLDESSLGISEAVFPWIATIFIKNDSKENQFEYYCDGALLNEQYLLTSARCVSMNNYTVDADNLLIVLGKKSLHAVGEEEKVHKVKCIITHKNYTIHEGVTDNDLAVLQLDEPISFNGAIQPAAMIDDDSNVQFLATTAWGFTGELTPIVFDKKASKQCNTNSAAENTFCATYGNNVALCPSYGGLHISKQTDRWYLTGIRTGDPEQRGICLNRDVTYTDLFKYWDWIKIVISQ